MSGHVFLSLGKARWIACDAYLAPCKAGFEVVDRDLAASPEVIASGPPRPSHLADRVARFADWPAEIPEPWMVIQEHPERASVSWHREGVQQFLAAATDALAGRSRFQRVKPLLALDLGPLSCEKDCSNTEYLQEILLQVNEGAKEFDVDVALVTTDLPTYLLLQAERRKLPEDAFSSLDSHWRQEAEALARYASREELVLAIGPKAGAGMGLPLRKELFAELATSLDLSSAELDRLFRLSLLEQASALDSLFQDRGRDLRREAASRFERPFHSLTHSLLASLPVKVVLTTSYDTFYQQACESIGEKLSVIPYQRPAGSERRLLKLHGCVHHPAEIILTRADHQRESKGRSLLDGLAQSFLVSRHVLFVGFSLRDDKFFQNTFFKIVDSLGRSLGAHSPRKKLATSLHFFGDPLLATLWKGKLSALVFGEAVPPDADSQVWKLAKAEASRTQKIFLDYLLSRVDFTSSHLLDAEFEGVLSQQERLLRDHLRTFLSSVPEEAREAAAWWRLEALHDALGGPRSKEPEE